MNREQAVIRAANVLGKAAQKLNGNGWGALATECENAVKDLQASVAESRELDAVSKGTHIHQLIEAATKWLNAAAFSERVR